MSVLTSSDIWIGIDLGTQSVRALAASDRGDVIGAGSAPLASIRNGNRHEQDPESWWTAVGHACRMMLERVQASHRIQGVAICGTSGTVLLTGRAGDALTPGLMYDDARAAGEAEQANEAGAALWDRLGYKKIQTVWGLPKLMWLLRHREQRRDQYLAHQTDFIAGRLAGHRVPSDVSSALKTGCDTPAERWDASLMEGLGIPAEVLPELRRPGAQVGTVGRAGSEHTGIPVGTAIIAGMTDGCASQLSSGAMTAGDWNSVLGTTLVLKGTSRELVHDPNGIVYSHRSPDGQWLPGGASSSGAGALSHYLPGADLDAMSAQADRRAEAINMAYPLASSQGERFPFIARDATGFFLHPQTHDAIDTYLSLTYGLAAIERLCFDYLDLLKFPIHGRISLTGGTSRNSRWNKVRATMLGRELVVPLIAEPAFGMAVLASSMRRPLAEAVAAMVRIDAHCQPDHMRAGAAAAAYLQLVDELERRGWLPQATANHARKRASQ